MVDHEGKSIGKISNLGKPTVNDLERVINERIERESILVTDSLRAYEKIANENGVTHLRIGREVNMVQNMHSLIHSKEFRPLNQNNNNYFSFIFSLTTSYEVSHD